MKYTIKYEATDFDKTYKGEMQVRAPSGLGAISAAKKRVKSLYNCRMVIVTNYLDIRNKDIKLGILTKY